MVTFLIIKEIEFWATKSTHPSKMRQLVTSDVKICFPASYLNLHAQYSHLPNMPQGGTSSGLPYGHISRNPVDTPITYKQIHTSATYYQQSFKPATIVLWNRLPLEIVLRADLDSFREGICQISHQSPYF